MLIHQPRPSSTPSRWGRPRSDRNTSKEEHLPLGRGILASRARSRLSSIGDVSRPSSRRISVRRSIASLYPRRREPDATINGNHFSPDDNSRHRESSNTSGGTDARTVINARLDDSSSMNHLAEPVLNQAPLQSTSPPVVPAAPTPLPGPSHNVPRSNFPPAIDRLLPTDLRNAATGANAAAGTLLVLQGVVHSSDTASLPSSHVNPTEVSPGTSAQTAPSMSYGGLDRSDSSNDAGSAFQFTGSRAANSPSTQRSDDLRRHQRSYKLH